MTRYLGPERLITPGGWGGSWYKEGQQKESKPVTDNIYQALERRDPKFYLGISAQEIIRTKFENILYSNQSNLLWERTVLNQFGIAELHYQNNIKSQEIKSREPQRKKQNSVGGGGDGAK